MNETVDANGWTETDYDYLVDGARDGQMREEDFCDVMGAESDVMTSRPNAEGSGATGLTQMMRDTLRNLGWRHGHPTFDATGGDFGKAPVKVQLDFAFRYFADWRMRFGLRRWESRVQLYLANFLPIEIPHARNGDYVLAGQGKRDFVVVQNPALDRNRDGAIQVKEAEAFVAHAIATRAKNRVALCKHGVALAQRRTVYGPARPMPGGAPQMKSARDVAGVQTALALRGYDPGPIDGIYGGQTKAAVRAFQAAHGLVVDGWVGPYTFGVLSRPLPEPPPASLLARLVPSPDVPDVEPAA